MTATLNAQAVQIDTTAETTFGVTNAVPSWARLQNSARVTFTAEREMLGGDVRDYELTRRAAVRGATGGTITIPMMLRGSGTAAINSQVTVASELEPLMLSCGMVRLDAGIATAGATISSWSSPTLNVSAGHGARFPAGTMGYSSDSEIVAVQARSTDALTIANPAAFADAPTGDLRAMRTYYPGRTASALDLTSVARTIRLFVPGNSSAESDQMWTFNGCVGTFNIQGDARGLIVATFEMQFDSYAVEAISSNSPASIGSWPSAGLKALCSPVSLADTTIEAASFTFTLGNTIAGIANVGSCSGRSGWKITDRTTVYDAAAYFHRTRFAYRDSDTTRELVHQIVGANGNHAGIYIPALDARNNLADVAEQSGMQIAGVVTKSAYGPGDCYIGLA